MSRIIKLAAQPLNDEGQPIPGFVRVGDGYYDTNLPDLPEGATLVSEDTVDINGDPLDRYAPAALGAHANAILEARWERVLDALLGEAEIVREKMTVALGRNPTVVIIEQDIPPHRWLGE